MQNTVILGDKELSLDEQIELAEHNVQCAQSELTELINERNRIISERAERALDAILSNAFNTG